MSTTAEIQAKHAKHVLTPWLAQGGLAAPVIVRGEGRYLFDADGNKFFDLGSGLIAVMKKLGRKIASNMRLAMVVPGSGLVKQQAEREGLHEIFKAAGFEWREPGCSMCLAMNADRLEPGERCASTSNRNFEGRQGAGGRTHLVSPAMAAAAAIHGHFVDVRKLV